MKICKIMKPEEGIYVGDVIGPSAIGNKRCQTPFCMNPIRVSVAKEELSHRLK